MWQGKRHSPITWKEAGRRQATRQKKAERVGTDCGEKDEIGKKEIYSGDKI